MFAPQSEKIPANRAAASAFGAPPRLRDLAGQGRPLSMGERGHAERAYRADLGDVRVHDGPAARQSADAMGAHGWSWGEHVVLGNTRRPDTLNHELAPVSCSSVMHRRTAPCGLARVTARSNAMPIVRLPPAGGARVAGAYARSADAGSSPASSRPAPNVPTPDAADGQSGLSAGASAAVAAASRGRRSPAHRCVSGHAPFPPGGVPAVAGRSGAEPRRLHRRPRAPCS